MTTQTLAPKQLVILSGKGGTGKTSVCAALVDLASQSPHPAVFADADVDAANLALVTAAKPLESHSFSGSQIAKIDPQECWSCGRCADVCRFNAIQHPAGERTVYVVDALVCEGCAACVYACPFDAIEMQTQQDGEWFHSLTPYGHQFHAELFPAAENSGKLVTLVKQHAKLFAEDNTLPLILVDGPPGIGCPVISAASGANLALLVTEPGLSGVHDLERIAGTLQHFNIPALVVINKADLYPEGTEEIRERAAEYDYPVIGEIPFDPAVPQAMTAAQPITKWAPDSPAAQAIRQVWTVIQQQIFGEDQHV
ncbi:ATP-binding protein (plasmid) [Chloroflexota bacterium]|nr:ATP-binding protein [Chloroflexota bacterium]